MWKADVRNSNAGVHEIYLMCPRSTFICKIYAQRCPKNIDQCTMLLCLFLGYFGIHRFYVKKTATGVLFFFTLGLFGIGWIVDFIEILCQSFRDKQGLRIAK